MAKIETYALASQPLSFADRLIGTEVDGPIPNATKNFSLGELYTLFASLPAVGNLQQTLNAGNTATQNIILTGNIQSTTIKPTNIIDILNGIGSNGDVLIKNTVGINWGPIPTNNLQTVLNAGNTATQNIVLTGNVTSTRVIPGNIQDGTGSLGTTGQILSKTSTGIRWITATTTPDNLQTVLNAGNTATQNIILTGDITSTQIIPGNIKDDLGNLGTTGQLLSKTSTGIRWITSSALPTLQNVLDNGNTATQNMTVNGLITSNYIKPSLITDYFSSNGSAGQVLSSQGGWIEWKTLSLPTLQSVLAAGNSTTLNMFINAAIKPTNITDVTATNGTTGQILSKGASGILWINPPATSPLTTKGDLYSFSTTNARLPVGTNGQLLSADSTEVTGLKWIAAPATSPLTTKGDIYTFDTTNARLPVGIDGQLLAADSSVATGLKWINPTSLTSGYYAQYFSYVSQSATTNNVGIAMIFGTLDLSNGVSVVSDGTSLTKITFAHTGIYNLQFSTQFQNSDNAEQDVYIWLRKNGTTSAADVVGSTGIVAVPKTHGGGAGTPGHTIVSWNFLLDITAGDFYQIVWSTTDVTKVIIAFFASTSDHPSTASTLFTVTQPGGGSGGGGGGTPATPYGSVQFNNSGVFGGDSNFTWDNTNKRLGIGTTSPLTKLQIVDGNGVMGFPYEIAVFEKFGDTKVGIFSSTEDLDGNSGISLILGYTAAQDSNAKYPGFEFQYIGDYNPLNNYIRYNFIERNVSGNVVAATADLLKIFADGRIAMPYLSNSIKPNVVSYDTASGMLSFQAAGSGGGGISLPIPKVVLNGGQTGIQALDASNGQAFSTLTLSKYPTVITTDLTEELLSTYPIFVEMVHFKRKGRKRTTTGGHKKHSGYVAEPDLRWDEDGIRTWNVPWDINFWTRNQAPCWCPQGAPNPPFFAGVPVVINRPNWYQVNGINETIPVYQYLNSRFFLQEVGFTNTDGNLDFLETVIPVYGYKSPRSPNIPTNRYPYSSYYTPLYVAFRYIAWDENANNGRGQIISGPLSRVVRVSHRDFPFSYNFNASSILGVPCASIATKYEMNQLQCFFETRLP